MLEIMNKKYYTSKEAAEFLKIEEYLLVMWRHNKKNLNYTKLGGAVYYDEDELRDFMKTDKYAGIKPYNKEIVKYEVKS